MTPRIPLLSALMKARSPITVQVCHMSKTASSQAIRRNVPSAPGRLLEETDGPRNPTRGVAGIFDAYNSERREPPAGEERRAQVVDSLSGKGLAEAYMRQMPRRWQVGDVYAPHDLSPAEMHKLRRVTTVKKDLVDLLNLRPLDMYRNFSFISEYMTAHGRIMRSNQTGLRPVNQRKVAKAIRRAIGLGLHPSVHRHPEILMRERQTNRSQNVSEKKIGTYI